MLSRERRRASTETDMFRGTGAAAEPAADAADMFPSGVRGKRGPPSQHGNKHVLAGASERGALAAESARRQTCFEGRERAGESAGPTWMEISSFLLFFPCKAPPPPPRQRSEKYLG